MENEYQESKELYNLAKQIQEKYFAYVGYVDLEIIYFAEIIGFKSRKSSVNIMSGTSSAWVRNLLNMNSNRAKVYCMAVFSDEWTEIPQAKKEWLVFKMLYAVSPDLSGKIRSPDVMDYGFILEYMIKSGVGPYWEMRDDVPSLLKGDALHIPLPPEDQE